MLTIGCWTITGPAPLDQGFGLVFMQARNHITSMGLGRLYSRPSLKRYVPPGRLV